MDYLPSKKFIGTALLILIVWAGWFFFYGPTKDSPLGTFFYRRGDIETARDNQITPHDYGVALGTALRPLAHSERPNEVELLLAIIRAGSIDKARTEIESLKSAAREYFEAASAAEKISAPKEIESTHKKLVSALAKMGELSEKMSGALLDPIGALEPGKTFSEEANKLGPIFIRINEYFTANNVVFTDKEKISITIHAFE